MTKQTELALARTSPVFFTPLLGIFSALAVLAIAVLLWNHAHLDSEAWRATRWFMGDSKGYKWQALAVDPAQHPDAPWYCRVAPPLNSQVYQKYERPLLVFRTWAEPLTLVLIGAALLIYTRYRWRAALLLALATAGPGLMGELIRRVTGRLRPEGQFFDGSRNGGDNYWEWFRGFQQGGDLAFPSGHATLAFALAAVLIYLNPKSVWLVIPIAVMCAWSRVLMQAHFYSDVIMGAMLGYLVAKLICWQVGPRLGITPASDATA
ncbi:MAG: phosphatase PAP2 family protein [Phycisphaerae bacterium]